jgi:hypothetical protein
VDKPRDEKALALLVHREISTIFWSEAHALKILLVCGSTGAHTNENDLGLDRKCNIGRSVQRRPLAEVHCFRLLHSLFSVARERRGGAQ